MAFQFFTTKEPTDDKFTEEQTFKSGDTISKDNITGTNYLWTMIETKSGEIGLKNFKKNI